MTTDTLDRFDHEGNLERATTYKGYVDAFWPPHEQYHVATVDIGTTQPGLMSVWHDDLISLDNAMTAELAHVKRHGHSRGRRLGNPEVVADRMTSMAEHLDGDDRTALLLRAKAVRNGYTPDILQALTQLDERVVLVAGQLSTWYGKEVRGLPSAFAASVDPDLQSVITRVDDLDAAACLRDLHPDLLIHDVPVFAATHIFFCAGEANNYPKHIAYFLPEDEGVKHSPFKKTYYFANTHQALLTSAQPFVQRHLQLNTQFDPSGPNGQVIPTLGVLSHEHGHFVARSATDFADLNALDRWASVSLQEVCADVFGILLLSEVWAPALDLPPDEVIAYYLGECLRYVRRGFGLYPDSDGMALQLEYLLRIGALEISSEQRLVGDAGVVTAGLRSLARVLADHVLSADAQQAQDFFQSFGPVGASALSVLVQPFRKVPDIALHYRQEWPGVIAATRGESNV